MEVAARLWGRAQETQVFGDCVRGASICTVETTSELEGLSPQLHAPCVGRWHLPGAPGAQLPGGWLWSEHSALLTDG